MITKEEREALRKMCEPPAFKFPKPERQILNLLDALEEAEARTDKAERERDILAQRLTWNTPCPVRPGDQDFKQRWLEFAAQEAAKGKEE